MEEEKRQTAAKREASSLQDATGQGKETGGIRYPYPAPHVLAFMEDQFGSLEKMSKSPDRHAYHFAVMLVFYMEMQKADRLEEVVVMSEKERQLAALKFMKEKRLDMVTLRPYQEAATEVFSNALRARRKRST